MILTCRSRIGRHKGLGYGHLSRACRRADTNAEGGGPKKHGYPGGANFPMDSQYPLGHYIPVLELSRLVASQHLTVSYVTTPANVPRFQDFIDEALNCGIDLRLLVLPTPHVEGLPEGRGSSDVSPPESHGSIFVLANKLQQPFDAWMELQFQQQELAPPVCVVFDSFMGWVRQSAEKFSISSVEFNTSGAFGISGTNSASHSIMHRVLEKQGEECVVLSLDLPRPLRFKRNEIDQDYWTPDEMNPITKFLLPMLHGSLLKARQD
ncbi:hypothetical protein SUGI_0073960 [Cryptomeria japonica]|nr:hypothetical protein SUGI_0073960 [Cryptomeria japonica]